MCMSMMARSYARSSESSMASASSPSCASQVLCPACSSRPRITRWFTGLSSATRMFRPFAGALDGCRRLPSETTLSGMSWLTTAWIALNSSVAFTGVRSTAAKPSLTHCVSRAAGVAASDSIRMMGRLARPGSSRSRRRNALGSPGRAPRSTITAPRRGLPAGAAASSAASRAVLATITGSAFQLRIIVCRRPDRSLSARIATRIGASNCASSAPAVPVSANGSSNQNVEPSPSRLCSPIWPPRASTSCLAIVVPNPLPPNRRVIEGSAWVKLSKMRAWTACGMPIPVSTTSKRRRCGCPWPTGRI